MVKKVGERYTFAYAHYRVCTQLAGAQGKAFPSPIKIYAPKKKSEKKM